MRAASFSEERQPLKIDVVSVQSQVVYGRVGNNAAVPTLEALGLTVAAVPTVVLSNIPSYPSIHGGALPVEWFDGYLQDLTARGALNALRAVQVGYLGNAGQAVALCAWIETLLANRPHLRVVIDPVIGDQEHGIYSAEGIADVYRSGFTALANGLTPNAFELACLTGMPVDDLQSVVRAARTLLTGRTEWVAVTSAVPDAWTLDEMWIVVVTERQDLTPALF
ncbi:Pyridoxal kinase [plant metagenome]|uniref:pyridoxal kinase n=1 Tax=plant metagenome TaxID=1297885 RepID=A0A484P6X4_9ZZZZ